MPTQSQNPFLSGVIVALPIIVGYMAVGIPFGVLGAKMGIPAWILVLMSIFIFAGSAQYVAIQLLSIGSGFLPIISATFILNLRHFLMATSLGDALPKVRLPFLTYLAQSITDETFGMNIVKLDKEKNLHPMNVLGTNLLAHTSWVVATAIGAVLGNVIPIQPIYTAGALPIMFAVLLALQIKNVFHVILALFSIVLTVVLLKLLSGSWPFLITALIVPTLATIIEVKRGK